MCLRAPRRRRIATGRQRKRWMQGAVVVAREGNGRKIMATGVRARAYRRPKRGGESYSREFLERLARILVHSGHSPQGLMREFRTICSDLKEPARRWDPSHLGYLADIPHVITHWHADPQYLDSRGQPVPLPLRGR